MLNVTPTAFGAARAQTFKQIKFGANATILQARGDTPITLEQIAAQAPAVLATGKHESRSDRYEFIDTRGVLEGLLEEGFSIFEVRQGGSRIEGKREFTKHMLRLRYQGAAGAMARVAGRDTIIPEVVLTNAHDGSASYQMGAGAFRIVCANGLVAGELFEYVRIPHKGDVQSQVIDAAFTVVQQFPGMRDGAESMAALQLSPAEQAIYAQAVHEYRWPEAAPVPAGRLLKPRRVEDAGTDLWSTMNVVQENVIRGGIGYERVTTDEETGRKRVSHRKTGEVRSIDDGNRLNRAMWTMAQEMARLKA